jgi:uncharacterized protein RhaS with RHS repeats
LHYNRFRYYSPELGRYISADPIGQLGGRDPNVYRYVLGDPINLSDPLGLIWQTTGRRGRATAGNVGNWIAGRAAQAAQGGDENFPGMNPREYLGTEQEVVQEWVSDPENPDRDSEYPLGSERTVPQKLLDAPDSLAPGGSSIHWEPPVANRTYEDYPGQRVKYPWWYAPPSPNSCPVSK